MFRYDTAYPDLGLVDGNFLWSRRASDTLDYFRCEFQEVCGELRGRQTDLLSVLVSHRYMMQWLVGIILRD